MCDCKLLLGICGGRHIPAPRRGRRGASSHVRSCHQRQITRGDSLDLYCTAPGLERAGALLKTRGNRRLGPLRADGACPLGLETRTQGIVAAIWIGGESTWSDGFASVVMRGGLVSPGNGAPPSGASWPFVSAVPPPGRSCGACCKMRA